MIIKVEIKLGAKEKSFQDRGSVNS